MRATSNAIWQGVADLKSSSSNPVAVNLEAAARALDNGLLQDGGANEDHVLRLRNAIADAVNALDDADRRFFRASTGSLPIVAHDQPRQTRKNPAVTPSPVDFPAFVPKNGTIGRPGLTVASVLDPFSQAAFSFEWNNVALDPATWEQQMLDSRPDLLFIESAWQGNGGTWKYRFTGAKAPWPEVIALLDWCKENNVPSIFWNKEDPPHYDDFLKTARLFDVVFTSDVNRIPQYRIDLEHERIYPLAFAAQPRLHNPARVDGVRRDREVAFGGMYFRHKYPERRQQMDYLLPAAQKFKLDIFSRQLGADLNYQFPDQFAKNVVGSLEYDKMVTAYHAYKVFLNVNSVIDSPSMCARRIFEITASGASIVSPPTPAIEAFFPGSLIAVADDKDEAYNYLRTLLRSEGYRTRKLHLAQRTIWENHTYWHRVGQILEAVGLTAEVPLRTVSILAPTIRPHRIQSILDNVGRQTHSNVELIINLHGFDHDEDQIRSMGLERGIENMKILKASTDESLGTCLNNMMSHAEGQVFTKMDDDDYYGPNYLSDLLHALDYSNADLVGKASTYVHFQSRDATVLSYPGHEHRYSDFVRGGTLTGSRDVFLETRFREVSISEDSNFLKDLKVAGGVIYAADRFNYAVMRSANPMDHTWQEEDIKLFGSGDVKAYGNPITHVTV